MFLFMKLCINIAVVFKFHKHKIPEIKVVKVESVLLIFDMTQKLVILEVFFRQCYQYLQYQ